MATSQNGYKANDSSLIAKYTIARDVTVNIRKGDVSVVLLHFAKWYDNNIEPLTKSDTGGYNPRNIEGSTTLSNHASGTAVDLRWNKHPMGKKGTFTTGQTAKIRTQLKFYEGVIRWGGDYSGRIDEMHYEINKGPAEVARIAKKCKGETTPKPPAPKPKPPTANVVKKGATGQVVTHIQHFFRRVFPSYRLSVSVKRGQVITVDGDFGAQTEAWVKEFQERTGLKQDGMIGPKTLAKMRHHGYQF
jgi:peptidoglycan hydrolase-like protein with peptidoglycan-binding domain